MGIMKLTATAEQTVRTLYFKIDQGPTFEAEGVQRQVVGCSVTWKGAKDWSEGTPSYRIVYQRLKKDGSFYAGGSQSWQWLVPAEVLHEVVEAVAVWES